MFYVSGLLVVLGGGDIGFWTEFDMSGSFTTSRYILDETKVLPAIGELSTKAIGCS